MAFYAVAIPSVLAILFNKSNEPLFSYRCIFLYLLKRDYFPFYTQVDFRDQFTFHEDKEFPFVIYNNDTYFYSNAWSKELIIDNFNSTLNEQNVGSPHRYLSMDEIKKGWVIYDIGAAEGLQAKEWSKKTKQIIIFEPDETQCVCLKKTFESEIKNGKVIIIQEGVSNEYKKIQYGKQVFTVDSLSHLVKKYNLPAPNFIKADIEGEEMHLLEGAKDIIKSPEIEVVQITSYHRPHDSENIAQFFSQYGGKGESSEGVTLVNRDGLETVIFTFHHPIIRKCLYTFRFQFGPSHKAQ